MSPAPHDAGHSASAAVTCAPVRTLLERPSCASNAWLTDSSCDGKRRTRRKAVRGSVDLLTTVHSPFWHTSVACWLWEPEGWGVRSSQT